VPLYIVAGEYPYDLLEESGSGLDEQAWEIRVDQRGIAYTYTLEDYLKPLLLVECPEDP
jgi:hypothetical protein